jgi:hypothetical protein
VKSDRVGATGLTLCGRQVWQAMSSHWPTASPAPLRRRRTMPVVALPCRVVPTAGGTCRKAVFSSTTSTVDWNTRLVTGGAVAEMARLKSEDGGPIDIVGATLAGAAMRAGRRVRAGHRTGPGGRGDAVLHSAGRLGEPDPGGDPDVARGRGPAEYETKR